MLTLTSLLWLQSMAGGGSGANLTRHVKLIVLPLLMNRSEPPRISVIGSETRRNADVTHIAVAERDLGKSDS